MQHILNAKFIEIYKQPCRNFKIKRKIECPFGKKVVIERIGLKIRRNLRLGLRGNGGFIDDGMKTPFCDPTEYCRKAPNCP